MFTSLIVQIKLKQNLEDLEKRYEFTSLIVQIKHYLNVLQIRGGRMVYIPHSSDKTTMPYVTLGEDTVVYIPHSSDKTC